MELKANAAADAVRQRLKSLRGVQSYTSGKDRRKPNHGSAPVTIENMISRRTRYLLAASVGLVLVLALSACTGAAGPSAPASHPTKTATATTAPSPSPSVTAAPRFDKGALSLDDPNSIWVVVDKLRPLNPKTYVPGDLVQAPLAHANPPTMRKEAADAMAAMFAAGAAEGAGAMELQSSYRSYTTQVSVYNSLVASLGKAKADAQSARPGFSEHQTGLTADIGAVPATCVLQACFGDTTQGTWLAANAYRFGFLLRYPADKTPVTGYIYEPWHFRYIGTALATEMHTEGVTTLEEFFGLPAAPDYAP